MLKRTPLSAALTLFLVLLAACSALTTHYVLPERHPMELDPGRPSCSECHEGRDPIAFERFNHTPFFADTHAALARQNQNVCAMCHAVSFCNDCHATRVELKPSIRNQTETYRRTPHRGDFRTRHRFEGRLDPASCLRCHGNPKTAQTCAPCHR